LQVVAEGRRERKKRELHDRIYQTARALFLEQGFESTTVDQIAKAADVAVATFFNHFPNKRSVLQAMTGEVFDILAEMVQQQQQRQTSATKRIQGFAERSAYEIEGSPDLVKSVLLEVVRNAARPGEVIPHLSRISEPFAEIIRAGQRSGEFDSRADAVFVAELLVGAFNGALTQWLNDEDYPVGDRMRAASEFICKAIHTHEGSSSR